MLNALLKIFTLIGLILLLPIIAISAILILLEDGRPVFFIQERIGKDLKIFNIYKLRTMHKNTPNLGTHEVEKSSYLKTGSILRFTKVDELPQLLNFIKGELLLIGPRPGLKTQLKLKDERLKREVFSVVPGISGLGQVLGYDMSDPVKLSKIDALYISNKSIQLDFKILVATFFKPLRKSLMLRFRDQIKNIEETSEHV
jgi:O-antigen biosynthesis protein WbqP